MSINRDEAAVVLAAIDAAGARSSQFQRYRRFAPYLFLWGTIWLLANTTADIAPRAAGIAWMSLSLLGAAASFWLGARQHAQATTRGAPRARRDQGWRWLLCFLVIVGFQIGVLFLLPPLDSRQQDTFISVFWTFLYMGIGVWVGWRLFMVGLVATLLILLGYYQINSHFFLYMGCVSGGALIAGGLWLRRL